MSRSDKDDTPRKRPADPAPSDDAGETDAGDEPGDASVEGERDVVVPPRPVPHPIGEGPGNLGRRGEWFRRRGGAS